MIYLFGDPAVSLPSRRRSKPLLVSIAAHAVVTVLLMAAVPSSLPRRRTQVKRYQIQLIHFSSAELRAPVLRKVTSPPKARRVRLIARSIAKQTLIVADAPPDITLSTAIPLPLQLAWTPVKVQEYQTPPKQNVLSLPNEVIVAKEMVLPKVNQVAAEDEGKSEGEAGNYETKSDYETNSAGSQANDTKTLSPSFPGFTRVLKDPGGTFAASVLGPSPSADEYPDVGTGMAGRIVSTVYLSIGTKPNWSLEFCPEGGGTASGIDAPWPYTMFRPDRVDFPPGVEAILIRGVLSAAGEFTNLGVVLPENWAAGEKLLAGLKGWKFRPAMRNGQPVPVQVLLVIPQGNDDQ